ncbi:MAG TPA: hypothetical protein PKK48_01080 [Phycisphaerae bacterium]|nr:hypothetical protein [Phycisphaerae bacterium]
MIDTDKQQATRVVTVIKTALIALPIAAMAVLTLTSSLFDNPSDPSGTYKTPITAPQPQNRLFDTNAIPESLRKYRQINNLPTGLTRPMDIAWYDGRLYIAGDDCIIVMDPDNGQILQKFRIPRHPTAISVNDSFVAAISQDSLYSMPTGGSEFLQVAQFPADTSNLVAVAANFENFFVADSFSGTIYKIGLNGNILNTIHPQTGDMKFNVTSTGDFDVIFGAEGMLWIADPGRGQVMAFNTSGENSRNLNWGKHGERLANFSGAYNPVHIVMLPNTNIVTAELDPPRIKVYSDAGTLLAVVAWENTLPKHIRRLNLSTDAAGHIYVLDDVSNTIRIYEKLTPAIEGVLN